MTTEYVVYNVNTGAVVTHPVPREMAESICATNNNPAFAPRYAMRAVDFDYDELIENAHYEDVQNHLQRAIEDEYDRQWSTSLHAFANGPVLPALMVAWFVAQVMITLVVGA